MSRVPAILATVLAVALAPKAVMAQSDDAIASVTVTVAGQVVVVNTAGLAFGVHPATTTVHSSDVPTAASWNVTFNAPDDYTITFTLPSQLTNLSGATVPITYGATSAHSPALQFPFDPATGAGVTIPEGPLSIDILLGADIQNDGSGDVSVNLAGAADGTYEGTITLTVAAF